MDKKHDVDPLWTDKWGTLKTESQWLKKLMDKKPKCTRDEINTMFSKLNRVELINEEWIVRK